MKLFNALRIASRFGKTKNKFAWYCAALFKRLFQNKKSAQVEAMRCYAPASLSEDELSALRELQTFLSGKKNTQNGLVLNFGKESSENGVSLSRDKIYLRKEFTSFLLDEIVRIRTSQP